jgi:hypothetical protein
MKENLRILGALLLGVLVGVAIIFAPTIAMEQSARQTLMTMGSMLLGPLIGTLIILMLLPDRPDNQPPRGGRKPLPAVCFGLWTIRPSGYSMFDGIQ